MRQGIHQIFGRDRSSLRTLEPALGRARAVAVLLAFAVALFLSPPALAGVRESGPLTISPDAGLGRDGAAPILTRWTPLAAARPLQTRYPIFLAKGIMGFKALKIAGMNLGNYFRGVEDRLRRRGVVVFCDDVGLTNGVPERAQRLRDQVLALVPDGKVNIIAHSMGGMDARYAISRLGLADHVASLTTLSTPHRGTPVADWTVRYVGQDLRVKQLLDALGVPDDAFTDLTSDWARQFNRETPDAPGVRYFSLGGSQVWYDIAPPLIPFHLLMNVLARARAGLEPDPADVAILQRIPHGNVILDTTRRELERVRTLGVDPADRALWQDTRGANDGLVPVWSTPWGESFQLLDADHWDEIGWLTLHDTPAIYEALVARLAALGL